MFSKIKQKFLIESGQVVVIIALLLVGLVGMMALVVDEGSIYETRRQLQNAADAAALAGAQELTELPDKAVQTAIEYASYHGVDITVDNVQISSTFVSNDTITIMLSNPDTQLFFAPVLNVTEVSVPATATATVNNPLRMNGLMPWVVPMGPYGGFGGVEPGELYALKFGAGETEIPPEQIGGNFQAMAFDAPGGSEYRQNIVVGCTQDIIIGNYYPTETGNLDGPTQLGVDQRLGSDSHTFFDGEIIGVDDAGNYFVKNDDCPRVVYIPLIDEMVPPSENVQILKFAVFFIDFVVRNDPVYGNGTSVVGRFLDYMIAESSGDVTGYTGGVKIIRLVD